jgi:hypothetical protein
VLIRAQMAPKIYSILVTFWVCGGVGRGLGLKALRKAVKGVSGALVVYWWGGYVVFYIDVGFVSVGYPFLMCLCLDSG